MTAPVGIATLGLTQDAVTVAADALIQARADLNAAQDAAAVADLDYGNALRAQAAIAETVAYNDKLAKRDPARLAQLLASGALVSQPISAPLAVSVSPAQADVAATVAQAQAVRDQAEQAVTAATAQLTVAASSLSEAQATIQATIQPLEEPPTNG